MRITGTTKSGQGKANKNYERMIAAAAVHYPAVEDCGHFGTINVVSIRVSTKGTRIVGRHEPHGSR
jgi:hypothetical protein